MYFECLCQWHREIPYMWDQVKLQLAATGDRNCIRKKKNLSKAAFFPISSHTLEQQRQYQMQTCPCPLHRPGSSQTGQDKQMNSLAKDHRADFFFFFRYWKAKTQSRSQKDFQKQLGAQVPWVHWSFWKSCIVANELHHWTSKYLCACAASARDPDFRRGKSLSWKG